MDQQTQEPVKKKNSFMDLLSSIGSALMNSDIKIEDDEHSFSKSKDNEVEFAVMENNTRTSITIANSKLHVSKKTIKDDPK